ncbi:MAG: tetratricopeptide repeat protein [Hyphomonadaceae bacterium]
MALLAAGLALGLAACAPQDPEVYAQQQLRVCGSFAFAPERIMACSEVISTPQAPAEWRSEALTTRGQLFADQGQQARAVADFGRAVRLNPNNAQAYLQRGLLHHNRAAFNSAIANYDAALAIDPSLEDARLRREAALQGNVQDFLSEIEFLNEAIGHSPRNADLYNNRCWVRATEGVDLDMALYDCDEALRIEPGFVAALDSRGLVHYKLGEYEAAIADYEAALAIEPGRGHYMYGRGLARLGLGQVDEGASDLAAAEQAQPGVAALYRSYGAELPVATYANK